MLKESHLLQYLNQKQSLKKRRKKNMMLSSMTMQPMRSAMREKEML